jgi:predicted RNase H-like HicB family nuclease
MNLSKLENGSPIELEVTLVLTPQDSGKIAASVMEFPNCRVEAETRETAISELKVLLAEHLQQIEMVPVKISLSNPLLTSNPWINLFGVFKDRHYFEEVMAIIQAEREKLGDEDIDPSFYMPKSSD